MHRKLLMKIKKNYAQKIGFKNTKIILKNRSLIHSFNISLPIDFFVFRSWGMECRTSRGSPRGCVGGRSTTSRGVQTSSTSSSSHSSLSYFTNSCNGTSCDSQRLSYSPRQSHCYPGSIR